MTEVRIINKHMTVTYLYLTHVTVG